MSAQAFGAPVADALAQQLETALRGWLAEGVYRMVFSKPRHAEGWRRAVLEQKGGAAGGYWQIARYDARQVFHENLPCEALPAAAGRLAAESFLQLNGFSPAAVHTLLLTRKGHLASRRTPLAAGAPAPAAAPAHDRARSRLLPEGEIIPALVDMGLLTPQGHIVKAMHDKYRQIERFVEMVDDALRQVRPARLNIVDVGCGKSYLTFALYHFLARVRGIRVQMMGLDVKADVIADCEAAARRYGYDGLNFAVGDIGNWQAPFAVDMVLALHACDTATDLALCSAVRWGARMIFCVPCCQHELNAQMQPGALTLLGRYGIVQERFCALSTDALRARLLDACGYRTQLLEFIDLAHTPKNLLIRAVRRPLAAPQAQSAALAEVRALQRAFGFSCALYRLLGFDAAEEGAAAPADAGGAAPAPAPNGPVKTPPADPAPDGPAQIESAASLDGLAQMAAAPSPESAKKTEDDCEKMT